MLSNFKKFGNLKNAFFCYLAIYQIHFIHYRFTESGKAQNPLGQTDKSSGKDHFLVFSTTISNIGNEKILDHLSFNYFGLWKVKWIVYFSFRGIV